MTFQCLVNPRVDKKVRLRNVNERTMGFQRNQARINCFEIGDQCLFDNDDESDKMLHDGAKSDVIAIVIAKKTVLLSRDH